MKPTTNIFLYDDQIDLGIGQFASVAGFKLVASGRNEVPEAIKDDESMVYGYIHQVDPGIIDMLDTFYGLGIDLHERVAVTATLQGGTPISVYMYEFKHVEMA